MSSLTRHHPSSQPARTTSRGRLMTTVAVSALAATAFFALFYVIGAVVGLAVFAALGVALLVGGLWLWLRLGRGRDRGADDGRAAPPVAPH